MKNHRLIQLYQAVALPDWSPHKEEEMMANGIIEILRNKQDFYQDFLVAEMKVNNLKLKQKQNHVKNT